MIRFEKFRQQEKLRDGMQRMLRTIEREVVLTRHMIGKDALDPRVMKALEQVPRHEFMPANVQILAYDNGPASIGYGQTISQPYIVALMTDLLCPKGAAAILEIGTGSGYQAAVLACLVDHVYTTEIIPELGEQAAERLQRLGFNNVTACIADGYNGWERYAPFDGIIVTAACPRIPPPLLEQLKPGARLVIPVGFPHMHQELTVVEKDDQGATHTREVLSVAFVPLTGSHGR